jgi:hypothetical protein
MKPPNCVSIDLCLINRLWCANVFQFCGTIGRDHQHRDMRQTRFNDGRIKMRRSRARSAEQNSGPMSRKSDSERSKCSRTLVMKNLNLKLRPIDQGEGERS